MTPEENIIDDLRDAIERLQTRLEAIEQAARDVVKETDRLAKDYDDASLDWTPTLPDVDRLRKALE